MALCQCSQWIERGSQLVTASSTIEADCNERAEYQYSLMHGHLLIFLVRLVCSLVFLNAIMQQDLSIRNSRRIYGLLQSFTFMQRTHNSAQCK